MTQLEITYYEAIKRINKENGYVKAPALVSTGTLCQPAQFTRPAAISARVPTIGQLKDKKYRFISDPGHAWLEVPKADVYAAGIAQEISGYSYIHGKYVYLEEDCDAGLFIDAVKLTKDNIIDVYKDQVEIRDYQSWPAFK